MLRYAPAAHVAILDRMDAALSPADLATVTAWERDVFPVDAPAWVKASGRRTPDLIHLPIFGQNR